MKPQRKRGYKRRAQLNPKVKRQVTKIVKTQIAKATEDKQLVTDFATVSPLSITGGTPYLLSHNVALTQGAGNNQRLGDKIRITYMDVKIMLALASPWTYASVFKVLIFRLKNPEGALLSLDDLMVNSAGVGLNRPYRANYKDVIEIYYDKVHTIRPVGNVSTDSQYKYINFKKKLNVVQTYYPNATAGTIADIRQNAIYCYLWALGDSTANVSRGQALDFQVAMKYEDA